MSREIPPSVPQSKRTVKSHIDPITKQRKYKAENVTKEHGVTSGGFISSSSRRDPRIVKYWLEKGTMSESLIKRLHEIRAPSAENWSRAEYFLNKKDGLEFRKTRDFLHQIIPEYDRHLVKYNNLNQLGDTRNLDQNTMLGELATYLNTLKNEHSKGNKRHNELDQWAREVREKEIEHIGNISIQIADIIDHHAQDIGLNQTTRDEINFLRSKITEMRNSESANTARLVITKLKEMSESYGPAIEVIEKSVELAGGEINRLITDRRTTPKVRLLLESISGHLTVLSKIAHNKNGYKASDLFEFVSTGIGETELKEGIKVQVPFKTLKSKPLKGLYESIITRLFLGDNVTDIKLGNMIIIDHGNYHQIENIDFGNIFARNYEFNDILTRPDFLIDCIDEIGKLHQNHDKTEHSCFQSSFQGVSDKQEIFDTIETISKLKDEDLFRITENLKEIVVIQDEEGEKKLVTLVPADQRKKFFENLKRRRDQMKVLHESIMTASPQIAEDDLAVADLELADGNPQETAPVKAVANVSDDEDINAKLHASTIGSDEQISPEQSMIARVNGVALQEVAASNDGQILAPERDVQDDSNLNQGSSVGAENNQPQSGNVRPQESSNLSSKRKRDERHDQKSL